MTDVQRVVVRLGVRDVREIGANRSPVGPRGKALVARFPIEDGRRRRFQLSDEIGTRTTEEAEREIDVLDASGLEVGGEEDLVADNTVDDLDARVTQVDRESVA